MSLAGPYTTTKDGYNTFTIPTKAATLLFAKIHNIKNRRPVILNDDDVNVWLDDSLGKDDIMNVLEDDLPVELLNTYPVSKDIWNLKVDSNRPDIIYKVEYNELKIDY